MSRPDWDEYFKQIVKGTSTRSPCERLKVGCLLVKDNRIISQGKELNEPIDFKFYQNSPMVHQYTNW